MIHPANMKVVMFSCVFKTTFSTSGLICWLRPGDYQGLCVTSSEIPLKKNTHCSTDSEQTFQCSYEFRSAVSSFVVSLSFIATINPNHFVSGMGLGSVCFSTALSSKENYMAKKSNQTIRRVSAPLG